MEDNKSIDINSVISSLFAWADTEAGKNHKQFIISMIITLQHSGGSIPLIENKDGKGLIILWPKQEKSFGVLLSLNGDIVNVCKESDGRIFASTTFKQ